MGVELHDFLGDLEFGGQELQFHEIVRVQNSSSPGDCPTLLRNMVIRQYLPLEDRVQKRDWFILADLDPRVTDVQVRDYISTGAVNQYVQWTIEELLPGECVQIGYVAGMRVLDAGADAPSGARALTAPSYEATSLALNMSSLSQFVPDSFDWEAGMTGLEVIETGPELEFEKGVADWLGPEGVLATSALFSEGQWDAVVSELSLLFAGDPWLSASRTRMLAGLIMAVINSQTYGDTSGNDDAGGFLNGTHPGSRDWPPLLRQGLRILQAICSDLPGLSAPSDLDSLRELGTVFFEEESAGISCRCSERAFQALWMLRLARIPCRELCGQRLGLNLARGQGVLPPGATIGHRLIEVWDDSLDEWFLIDTTKLRIGPDIRGLDFVATYRGATGVDAPLVWGYSTEVVAADLMDQDSGTVGRHNVLLDNTHESSMAFEAGSFLSGAIYRQRAAILEAAEEALELAHQRANRIAVEGLYYSPLDAAKLKAFIATWLDSASTTGPPYFPLLAMVLSSVDLPPPDNACLLGRREAKSAVFAGVVLTLAGSQICFDPDLWFTRRYLNLPDPCSSVADAATVQRMQDTSYAGLLGVGESSRSAWAWNFVALNLYFAGSTVAHNGSGYPRFDCPGRVPGTVPELSPADFARELCPPFPADDLYQQPQDDWDTLTASWMSSFAQWSDMIAFLGRRPTKVLELLAKGDSEQEAVPEERSTYRLSLNRWGDLVLVPRPVESLGEGD